MFSRTNIEQQLLKYRSKRIDEHAVMEEVSRIFSENEKQRETIISTLKDTPSEI